MATTTPGGCPQDVPAIDLPRLLADRYRLDALIGEGGFGRVYRGFDTWLERPVAVKVPQGGSPGHRARRWTSAGSRPARSPG